MDLKIIWIIILLLYSPVIYDLIVGLVKEYKAGNRFPVKRIKKVLKYFLILSILLLIGFGIISHTNYLDYEKPIPYSRFDEITFKNFRGLEFFKKSLYGHKEFAYVVTTMEYQINDSSVAVEAYFHPSMSYVYNSKTNSAELLAHELYHFKITELYVRKAKKRIDEIHNPGHQQIETIINNTRVEERKYQMRYDYDTFHSYVYSEQTRYEKFVDSLLNVLRPYRLPNIQINVKK